QTALLNGFANAVTPYTGLSGNISVSGPNGGPYVVTFTNALANQAVNPLTVTQGPTTPLGNATVARTTIGQALPLTFVPNIAGATGNPGTGIFGTPGSGTGNN